MKQQEIRKELKNNNEKIISYQQEINKLKDRNKELQNHCNHSKTYVKEYYFSGSYYDHAYTKFTKYCVYCGKEIEVIIKEHSWFG